MFTVTIFVANLLIFSNIMLLLFRPDPVGASPNVNFANIAFGWIFALKLEMQ